MSKSQSAKLAALYEYRVAYSPEDGCFVARVTEWPSLAAHGDDQGSALVEMRDVVELSLADMVKKKETPPEPIAERKFSGRLLLRMPPELHRRLARDAARQDVPLNQLIVSRLAAE